MSGMVHDNMKEVGGGALTAEIVVRNTVRGAFSLGIRQVLVQGSRILGSIFLARLLTPSQFGVYAVILYLQTFLTAFGDAGLAASLIRQHEEPGTDEYRAVFTIQQILVFSIAVAIWFLAPALRSIYHLRPEDAKLFRILALSFLASSFTVIPVIRLERRLAFDKVALVEASQAIVFNVFAVYLAWIGFGSFAFVYALLGSTVTGALIANWISWWRIGWRWDWPLICAHMSFGLPFQGIQVASLLKDSISPVLIGILLGTADVGYIMWAGVLAAYPVMVLFILQRLYMPAFARLQRDRIQLASLVENVIWGTNAITAPLAILTLAMIRPITTSVYGAKWLVALPYFYLFWLANLFVPTATPAMGLLNALGNSRTAFMFAVLWMAGTWMVGAPLILIYGPIGFAIANLAVNLSNVWLYRIAQRQVQFRIVSIIAPGWAIASVAGGLVYVASRFHTPIHFLSVAMYLAAGVLIYGGMMYLFYRQKIHTAWSAMTGAG